MAALLGFFKWKTQIYNVSDIYYVPLQVLKQLQIFLFFYNNNKQNPNFLITERNLFS